MRTITPNEARIDLSRWVDQAVSGDAFITRNGDALVRVVPCHGRPVLDEQRIGFLADRMHVPVDFDRLGGVEIEALFEGRRAALSIRTSCFGRLRDRVGCRAPRVT